MTNNPALATLTPKSAVSPSLAPKASSPEDTAKKFEPPRYLESLITSINEGARAAQTGALFFTFIGLYLLAVAFSTTDEDLLRQKTVAISELNVGVPVVFSFGIAPIVLVFLHVQTLIRYEMLAANLQQFHSELATLPDDDNHERCRHLFANIEFLRVHGTLPGTPLASKIFLFMSWFILALFPLIVLTILQLSSIRYQSENIIFAQRLALHIDMGVLIWFYHRRWLLHQDRVHLHRSLVLRQVVVSFLWVTPLVVFNWLYMGVPSGSSTTVETKLEGRRPDTGAPSDELYRIVQQPIDEVFCKDLKIFCRFLTVDNRLLVANSPPAEDLRDLRMNDRDKLPINLATVDGLILKDRNLRFVDFSGSRLYGADFTNADLTGANWFRTQLQGIRGPGSRAPGLVLADQDLPGADFRFAWLSKADLRGAWLQDADFSGAWLKGANLRGATLRGANLYWAMLENADLGEVSLRGANLVDAELENAKLGGASLHGANLEGASLHGANLAGASLKGANLRGVSLQGADLTGAMLQGANLEDAELQGANLRRAQLQGANLRGVALWQARFDEATDLSLADLRGANFAATPAAPASNARKAPPDLPVEPDGRLALSHIAMTPASASNDVSPPAQPTSLLSTPSLESSVAPPIVAKEGPALVETGQTDQWRVLDPASVVTDEASYDAQLAPYLLDVTKSNADVAPQIARRIIRGASDEAGRSLYPQLARLLLQARADGDVRLPDDMADQLKPIAARAIQAKAVGRPAE